MRYFRQCFQPPDYWQQFEDLTMGVLEAMYGDPKPQKFGRQGQAQHGVDVTCKDTDGRLIGVQCKRMDELDENNNPRPGGKITKKIFDAEWKKAKKFKPTLDTWIFATTAKTDANIQRYSNEMDRKSRASGSFGILVWHWEDYVTDLNRHHDLQSWYYEQVIHVKSPDDQDRIILELLGEAFSRAAFATPLFQETPANFIQALKDTQTAMSTGELKDRETRRVIRKTIGGRRAIESQGIRDLLDGAYDELQQLRDQFEEALKTSVILDDGGILNIPPQLLTSLNAHRDSAIAHVNDALKQAGLPPI